MKNSAESQQDSPLMTCEDREKVTSCHSSTYIKWLHCYFMTSSKQILTDFIKMSRLLASHQNLLEESRIKPTYFINE